MTTKLRRLGTALAATAALAAVPAAAQASGYYSTLRGDGYQMPSGSQLLSNHCDDCLTAVHLPFKVKFYGAQYQDVNVSSNGNIQFTPSATYGTFSAAYSNTYLPTNIFGATLAPYWDDLTTYSSANPYGVGIFTKKSGTAPHRKFIIEWRTLKLSNNQPVNFAVVFNEGKTKISTYYGVQSDYGAEATVGVQDGSSAATNYEVNGVPYTTGSQYIYNGTRIDYVFHAV